MPINRLAAISLMMAVLTVISFCIGFAPFLPLTSLVCYPLAVVLGGMSFLSGVLALRQMRLGGSGGRWMALTGIGTGVLVILAVGCATTLTVTALVTGVQSLRLFWPTPGP
ncbi:MAG: hypothetical protein DDG60_05815 [Anaerolineae bacterium]|nr:MAG: hypothetical protein DDG60_05815 [Anaerolineae bacterium]